MDKEKATINKKEHHKKAKKANNFGKALFPNRNNFNVGNGGLRRTGERWDDMQSLSCEVGEI